MLVSRVRQEGAALRARAQFRRHERELAQFGHHAAGVQAPMGVEVVHDPVAAGDPGGPARGMAQVRREVATTNEPIKARVPWRMESCSRLAGQPGRAGCVG
jgi:hypothetical protein